MALSSPGMTLLYAYVLQDTQPDLLVMLIGTAWTNNTVMAITILQCDSHTDVICELDSVLLATSRLHPLAIAVHTHTSSQQAPGALWRASVQNTNTAAH
jgi:hypothetical protein